MPTYVYKFIDTGETIEVQQAFTDDALTEAVHPTTGTTMKVKKVFLPVGVTFRGDGFYKTDSRGSGTKKAASSEASADKPAADSSAAKPADTSTGTSTKSTTSTTGTATAD